MLGLDSRSVRFTVRPQDVVHLGRRLEGGNAGVLAPASLVERADPDVGPDIDHRVTVLKADAMPPIALILENLLVEVLGLIAVQVSDFQTIGQYMPGSGAEAFLRPFPAERRYAVWIPRRPLLQAQQDDVDP